MKITSVELATIEHPLPPGEPLSGKAQRPAWPSQIEVANPMSRFPKFKSRRHLYQAKRWPAFGVKVVAEDGTWGIGTTSGRPVAAVIEDAFAHILVGEECTAIEKLWDMMFRASKPFGTVGISSIAISAVDLALWDLVGKLKNKPVYELIGGPTRENVFVYATGNDVDWYQELGFSAFKLPCQYGPTDGLWGLDQNEKVVAETRKRIGDHAELMLDCYMAFDVDYTVRLAERLRPYRLKWIEEFLIPEDVAGHIAVRKRLPWMTLAGGEHLYTHFPFQQMIEHRCLDILQPDIHWAGGLTACIKICHMAEAAGLQVILHGGGNDPYGQHLTWAMPNIPWGEYFVGSDPGIPLSNASYPNAVIPSDSFLPNPPTGPGFGLDISENQLHPFNW